MKNYVNQNDLLLKSHILPYGTPEDVPLSFRMGDRLIQGIPEEFSVTVSEEPVKEAVLQRAILARDPAGLEIRVEQLEYLDFPATEWVAYFTNKGTESTGLISDIRIGGVLPLALGTLCHGNGDTHSHGCYKWFTSPLTEKIELSPKDGTSCNGAFPYMRLLGKDFGVNAAVGWTGRWQAAFEPVSNGVRLSVGQARCHLRILPGETIRTPRLTLVAYQGDEARGRNMWRRWYFKHILPPVEPMCCMHYFKEGGYPEFTGATQAGQLQAIDTYLHNGIRPDVLWMDAGWYPCDHNWRALGDWRPDPARFPNGLAPIGEK